MKQLIILLFITCSTIVVAQETNTKEQDLIETALVDGEDLEENLENENILEDLYRLSLDPININDTLADLTLIHQYNLLTPLQTDEVKKYIRTHGSLLTVKELYAVPFITIEQANKVTPYLTTTNQIKSKLTIGEQLRNSRGSLVLRNQYLVEQQRGFRDTDGSGARFAGDRNRLYFKYRQQYKDKISFGLLGDKDSGESLFSGSNSQGFDFYSGHLYYKPENSIISQAMVGDFEVKIGQGLVQWNGFALGKGSDASAVFLKGPRIRPYTSANEFNYLRGGSTELRLSNKFKTQLWYSNKRVDANVNQLDTLDNDLVAVTSLQISGLHRTEGEIENERSVNEQVVGANIDYEGSWFTVGVLAQNRTLSDSLSFSNSDFQRFNERGTDFQHASIHYSGLKSNLYFFGETAYSSNNAFATTNGIQRFFDSGLKATVLYRNFQPEYQSLYASSLSENTNVTNEEAVYVGMTYSPAKDIKIQTYFDRFWFPFNRSRVDRPSGGTEWFLRAEYFANSTEFEFRTRIENKDADQVGNTTPNNFITNQKRISNRLEVRHRPTNRLYLKTRVAHSAFETETKDENGFLIFQDIVYTLRKEPIKLYGRLAAYNTPSFDSRIFAYENDLLYNFSVPAHFGEGVRWYAMTSYQPARAIKLWLKGSQTVLSNTETISSGNSEIEGNTRTDIRFQVQWKF